MYIYIYIYMNMRSKKAQQILGIKHLAITPPSSWVADAFLGGAPTFLVAHFMGGRTLAFEIKALSEPKSELSS